VGNNVKVEKYMENQTEQKPTHNIDGIPYEAAGWNWGAFLLGPIWGIFNRVWLSLLIFIPFVGIVMWIVVAAKGSQWAWKQKPWKDVRHFKRTQLNWALGGLGLWVLLFVIAGATSTNPTKSTQSVDSSSIATTEIQDNKTARLGEHIQIGDWEYQFISAKTSKTVKGLFNRESPDADQFIVIKLKATNIGMDKCTLMENFFKLRDRDGAEYEHSSKIHNSLFLKPLNPHGSFTAEIAFEVPNGSVGDFTLEASGGFSSSDKVMVDLSPLA
jgi:hypothetical protein